MKANVDEATVRGFGEEWSAFDQEALTDSERQRIFEGYFSLFTFDQDAEGFDLGCGSGRWARLVAPRVKRLHCIDPSIDALNVAKRNVFGPTEFHLADAGNIPLPDNSQDFGYSLGVLHHIPDTQKALSDAVRKVKPGGQFLVYLYYRFDNRPAWFRAAWRASDVARRAISHLPFPVRVSVTNVIAATVYWPLAMLSRQLEKRGRDVEALPLSFYRNHTFYTMRTDALDRFGTQLEQRFTREEIATMMTRAGLKDIRFREGEPWWVAHGIKIGN